MARDRTNACNRRRQRRTVNRRAFLAAGTTTLATVAGCVQAPQADDGGSSPTPAPTRTPEEHGVEMTDDLTFEPETLTIAAGDRVVWRNVGSAVHTVTAYGEDVPDGAAYFASGGFESEQAAREAFPEGGIEAEGTYAHTFAAAGEYRYFCVPHEQIGMRGTVAVE